MCVYIWSNTMDTEGERDTYLINKHINMSDSEELGQIIWMQTLFEKYKCEK